MTEPAPDPTTAESQHVRKRTVVLLPGFDPRGASHYHKMLARQFDKFADREQIPVSYSPRKRWKGSWHRWNISKENCSVTFLYGEWDDVVRKYWQRGKLRLFIDSCKMYLTYFGSMRYIRGCSGTRYSQIGFYYPLVSFLFLYAALISLAVWLAHHMCGIATLSPAQSIMSYVLAVILGAFISHKISPRLNGGWLLRIFCFTRMISCQGVPELKKRFPELARDLAEELKENPPDELLVVGHSVGAVMAIWLLHELFENTDYSGNISYMSLGQCIQLVTFLETEEGEFNQTLRKVVVNPRLRWIDFTMTSDGACIALQDPLLATFRDPPEYPHKDLPKFLSAHFTEGYSPTRFKELKRDPFEYHFQYYMTHDKRAQFEFATMVLGEMPLAARFAHRKDEAHNRTA
jgi:hypothetical protein